MAGPERIIAAALLATAYAALCGATLWRAWRARRDRRAALAVAQGAAGQVPALLIAHASQTGFAEQLAGRSADMLRAGGLAVAVAPLGSLDAATLAAAKRALFIVSTTGEGDAPDGAGRFLARAMGAPANLASLGYGLLALGDRSYARFCGFGRALDDWLGRQHATPLFDRVEVDDGDEGALRHWQQHLARLGGDAAQADWSRPDYESWRLVRRRVLNPGSAGAPVYLVELQPAGAGALQWQAGDLVEVEPGEASLPHREYSIASLPADGALQLVVRQMWYPDGRPGLGSGWLTGGVREGGEVRLRVRENRSFAAPPDERPMILIGNGTGIAGLRAHIKARAALGRHRNWLLFGERSAAHDRLFGEEIDAWLAGGVLERVDLAYSRDPPRRVYVQDRVREAADTLREWMAQGAAIHVCGSLEGMAGGVAAALTEVLGEAALADLAAAGRYRRDVY